MQSTFRSRGPSRRMSGKPASRSLQANACRRFCILSRILLRKRHRCGPRSWCRRRLVREPPTGNRSQGTTRRFDIVGNACKTTPPAGRGISLCREFYLAHSSDAVAPSRAPANSLLPSCIYILLANLDNISNLSRSCDTIHPIIVLAGFVEMILAA